MPDETTIDRVILVPGLLEPPSALALLARSLRKRCPGVELWRDRLAFRNVPASVDRLAKAIGPLDWPEAGSSRSIALVTHSFGDWVTRAAIAQTPNHRVAALVSLAPVMKAGFLPSAAYWFSGNLLPEIKIIMDPARASANRDCDPGVRRLVIWSRFDESLRQVDLSDLPHVQVARVWATHLTIPFQRGVHRRVSNFLFGGPNATAQTEQPDTQQPDTRRPDAQRADA